MTTTTEGTPPTTSPTSTAPAAGKMTHRETLEALSGILLGMFVALLATSVTSSSLPKIITDLDGSSTSYTWVVTATLLTMTISTPIWGKLADLMNRKVLVQIALIITVLSSAAAGFAQNTGELIACRAFQGIGAGGLTALGTVLMADIISPRERGKYMGLMGGVMAISQVGGPILGGVITDSWNWRWNFFIGLPFAIIAIVVLQRTLHLPPMARKVVKIDYWGAALISVGVALLLLWVTFAAKGADNGGFAWASWQTAVMVGVAVVSLVAAVLVELRVDEPLIPMRLFRNRTLVLAVLASISVGVAMFGTAVFLSQYLQISRGKTPTVSGLLTTPMVLGTLIASIVFGQLIARTGRYKKTMVVGGILLTAGLALLSTIDYQTSFVLISVFLFVLGLGTGMLMQNLVLAVQNTLDVSEVGAGTSVVAFFRSLGGAIGVSVLGAIMSSRVTSSVRDGLAELGITSAGGGSGTLPDVHTLPGPVRLVIEKAYGEGIAEIFLVAVPLAAISVICVLLMREVPLDTRSGVEHRLERDADGVTDGVTDGAAQLAAADGASTDARSAEARAERDTAVSLVAPVTVENEDSEESSAADAQAASVGGRKG